MPIPTYSDAAKHGINAGYIFSKWLGKCTIGRAVSSKPNSGHEIVSYYSRFSSEDSMFIRTRWSLLAESFSFGNNNDANVFCLLNNSQNEVTSEQVTPRAIATSAKKDLRNLIAARKVHDCFCRIITFQYPRFDMEISREVQVFFKSVAGLVRQASVVPRHNGDCEAIGPEIVRHHS